MREILRALAFGAATWSLTASAFAYCRTTVCDPRKSCEQDPEICCVEDGDYCDVNTAPISWPTSCVSYNVHEDGSSKLDISAGTLSDILDDAFDSWLSVNCGDGLVSLGVEYRGTAECGKPEYNLRDNDRNANVWMFRDSGTSTGTTEPMGSRLDAAALAVTTVSFNEETAQIYDVDVELLSSVADFTTSDTDVSVDLASVVTHEVGHFLGLDHSRKEEATMQAGYVPGSIGPRTLTQDDEAGICAVYPEDRDFPGGQTCEPRGKYSPKCEGEGCGCRIPGQPNGSGSALLLGLALVGLVRLRRRGTHS